MTLLEVSYQTDPYKPGLTIIEFLILASPFFITDIFFFFLFFLVRAGGGVKNDSEKHMETFGIKIIMIASFSQ